MKKLSCCHQKERLGNNMKAKKSKSAKEILTRFYEATDTFSEYRKKSAKVAHEMLGKVLQDVELQRELSIEYEVVEIKKYPARLPFPGWARHLSYVLTDPDNKYSELVKEKIYSMCRDLYLEFVKETDDRNLTKALKSEGSVPILSDMAKDLWIGGHKEKPRSDDQLGKSKLKEVC